MTSETTKNTEPATSAHFDVWKMLEIADAQFGEAVDWDMGGRPITSANVLLVGAYGPAVRRLLALVLAKQAEGPCLPIKAYTLDTLKPLAEEAFAQAVDIDFGGNVMTNYGIVLSTPHGFGDITVKLVNLALQGAGTTVSA